MKVFNSPKFPRVLRKPGVKKDEKIRIKLNINISQQVQYLPAVALNHVE